MFACIISDGNKKDLYCPTLFSTHPNTTKEQRSTERNAGTVIDVRVFGTKFTSCIVQTFSRASCGETVE